NPVSRVRSMMASLALMFRLLNVRAAQALDYSFAKHTRAFFDGSLIECQQLPVAHNDLAINNHRLHVGSFSRIHEIRIDIVERYLIQRVAVDEDQIRALPLLYRANLFLQV